MYYAFVCVSAHSRFLAVNPKRPWVLTQENTVTLGHGTHERWGKDQALARITLTLGGGEELQHIMWRELNVKDAHAGMDRQRRG